MRLLADEQSRINARVASLVSENPCGTFYTRRNIKNAPPKVQKGVKAYLAKNYDKILIYSYLGVVGVMTGGFAGAVAAVGTIKAGNYAWKYLTRNDKKNEAEPVAEILINSAKEEGFIKKMWNKVFDKNNKEPVKSTGSEETASSAESVKNDILEKNREQDTKDEFDNLFSMLKKNELPDLEIGRQFSDFYKKVNKTSFVRSVYDYIYNGEKDGVKIHDKETLNRMEAVVLEYEKPKEIEETTSAQEKQEKEFKGLSLKNEYGEINFPTDAKNVDFDDEVVNQTLNSSEGKSTRIFINKPVLKDYLLEVNGAEIFRAVQGRFMVVAKVENIHLPFYISSAGTDGKKQGEWYPFFGYNGSWLVKGHLNENGEMNYHPEITKVQKVLNENLILPADFISVKGELKATPAGEQNEKVYFDINKHLKYQNPFLIPELKKVREDKYVEKITGYNPKKVVIDKNESIDKWIGDIVKSIKELNSKESTKKMITNEKKEVKETEKTVEGDAEKWQLAADGIINEDARDGRGAEKSKELLLKMAPEEMNAKISILTKRIETSSELLEKSQETLKKIHNGENKTSDPKKIQDLIDYSLRDISQTKVDLELLKNAKKEKMAVGEKKG